MIKSKRQNQRYGNVEKNKVIRLHLKGILDGDISKKTGYSRSYVQKITTNHWKNKMKKIKVGSDYSGVGAFNQSLKRLNIKYTESFACDLDKFARKTFVTNNGTAADIKIVNSKEHDSICETMFKIVEGKLELSDAELTEFYDKAEKLARSFSFYYPINVYNREIPSDSLDVYMTSPPCQGFSMAGKRAGSILFFNSLEFIQKNKPRFFIFENVKGLLSHEKKDKNADYGQTFNSWINYLGGKSVNGNPVVFPYEDSVPYHIYFDVLNSEEYGVPQNRERVFIIGVRDDVDNNFRFPIPVLLEKTLRDVLETDVPEKYYLSDEMVANLIKYNERQVENGNGFAAKFRDIETTDIMDTIKVGGGGKDDLIKVGYINQNTQASQVYDEEGISPTLSAGSHGYANGYVKASGKVKVAGNLEHISNDCGSRVYDTTGIAPTIMARADTSKILLGGNKHIIEYNNLFRIRRLTPLECFRLMDFPDEFILPCSDTQTYKQAGNGIVVAVLTALLSRLNIK